MSAQDRKDRLFQLITICVKNNLTPDKIMFAGVMQKACSRRFGLDRRIARGYIQTLVSAYIGNKWKTLVKEDPYLTEEETTQWIAAH